MSSGWPTWRNVRERQKKIKQWRASAALQLAPIAHQPAKLRRGVAAVPCTVLQYALATPAQHKRVRSGTAETHPNPSSRTRLLSYCLGGVYISVGVCCCGEQRAAADDTAHGRHGTAHSACVRARVVVEPHLLLLRYSVEAPSQVERYHKKEHRDACHDRVGLCLRRNRCGCRWVGKQRLGGGRRKGGGREREREREEGGHAHKWLASGAAHQNSPPPHPPSLPRPPFRTLDRVKTHHAPPPSSML